MPSLFQTFFCCWRQRVFVVVIVFGNIYPLPLLIHGKPPGGDASCENFSYPSLPQPDATKVLEEQDSAILGKWNPPPRHARPRPTRLRNALANSAPPSSPSRHVLPIRSTRLPPLFPDGGGLRDWTGEARNNGASNGPSKHASLFLLSVELSRRTKKENRPPLSLSMDSIPPNSPFILFSKRERPNGINNSSRRHLGSRARPKRRLEWGKWFAEKKPACEANNCFQRALKKARRQIVCC